MGDECFACATAEGRAQAPSEVVTELTRPEQVSVTLCSHMGAVPVQIVQPVTRPLMDELGVHGLRLQPAMFDRSEPPPPDQASSFAETARACYGRGGVPPPSMQSAR